MTRRRFGSFELDTQARSLCQHGQPIKLHDQPLEVLIALTDRAGEVVTREELRRRLWPDDTFVDYDNSLNNALSRLRDCLEDDAARPRLIETVPKRGYRFIAEVHANDEHSVGRVEPRQRFGRVASVAIALVAVTAGLWLYTRSSSEPPARQRLLVLPFENLTGDATLDYVVDGLTDDLITHLGRLSPHRLAVVARTTATSYKGTTRPLTEIASELGVDHLIEGVVGRKDDRWHVTVRLIRASDATQTWAEMFDGPSDGLSGLFDRITTHTAGRITATIGGDHGLRARAATLSTDAFDAWLRGRHEWHRFTPDGFVASIQWYRHALILDPTFATAAAALAQAWVFLGVFDASRGLEAFTEASEASSRALELDPESADGIAMRGMVKLFRDLDRDGASRDFEAAVARAANDALILHWAAAGASARGDHARSLALAHAAQSLDPKSIAVNSDLGWYFYYARRYDDALRHCTAAASISPSAGGPALCREMVLRATLKPIPGDRTPKPTDPPSLYREAVDSLSGGNRQEAIQVIQVALASRASWVPFIAVDPVFDPLRNEAELARVFPRLIDTQ